MWKRFLATWTLTMCVFSFMVGCTNNSGNVDVNGNGNDNAYGDLVIENITVSIDQNKNSTFTLINPTFTKPEKAEKIKYLYDESFIKITEDGVCVALRRENKTINVKAVCEHEEEHFRKVFSVKIEYMPFEGVNANSFYRLQTVFGDSLPVENRQIACSSINENTTLFIGDSFMDEYFIGEYMSTYAVDKEIIISGIRESKMQVL